jgi:MFS family permease
MASLPSTTYFSLLKGNRSFRNLWYGQIVSELGDWLNSIAIFTLILSLGGSGLALGTVMMAKLLPIFFVSPIAGVVVDRMNRKWVMILSDLARFVVVLGFLFVTSPEELWLVYTLAALEIALAGFFEPARSALLPSVVDRRDLVAANALSGSTWSVMLALGAALGGVVVSLLGTRAAFILDAFTFLVSASFIFRVRLPAARGTAALEEKTRTGIANFMDGLRYIIGRPGILMLTLLKSGLATSGGVMTLIPLYAHQMLASPEAVSMATGILYSCRGVGAAAGPVLIRRWFGDSSRTLQVAIAGGFFLGSVSIGLFGLSSGLLSASASLALIGLFGSIIWVFSTALIHLEADTRFMGRVFSMEMGLLTLVMGLSNWAVGYAVEEFNLTANQAAGVLAVLFTVPGIVWTLFFVALPHCLKEGKCVGPPLAADPSGLTPPPVGVRPRDD